MDQEQQQQPQQPEQPHKAKSFALLGIEFSLEFIKTTLLVILVALVFRYFLIQPFIVVGQSMEPNFQDKEYLIIDKLSYKFRQPKRGEVIIFHPPQSPRESYIKRVIGLPGEKVEVKDGKVYINDKLLQESYILKDGKDSIIENNLVAKLGENDFFVFGDNRNHSSDSREIGPIPKSNIQGKVAIILFPVSEIKIPKTPTYSTVSGTGFMFGEILSFID